MTATPGPTVWRRIRALATAQGAHGRSDGELLDAFLAAHDEEAFAAIVHRHGGMVLAVCRSVLHHQQDAEDVFQAAFLVLARHANSIRKQQALSSWLHGVAYRLALKAKMQRARRQVRETRATAPAEAGLLDNLTMREALAILHEELHGMPEKYRAALLACYWEGKTRDEAAQRLGISADSFKKCLERARNLLGSRLVRRGLAPSAALLAALLSESVVDAAVSSGLARSTAQAAAAFAAGKGAPAAASAAVALAEGVLRTMNITKWTTTILTAVLTTILCTGMGVATYRAFAEATPDEVGAAAGGQLIQAKQKPIAKQAAVNRLVGTWRFLSGVANGTDLPAEFIALARITFAKDGKMTMAIVDEAKAGTYKLVGAGQIDLTGMGENDTTPAIYKFDADGRLVLCLGKAGANSKRPTEFTGAKESGQGLLILQRAKPGEEKPTPEEIAKFKGGVDKVREAAARAQSQNNLKQIGLAMHNYHDVQKSLPAHAIYSKDGKTPLLSWRVVILPFLEQEPLYKEFKLDEPWDSEHNKKLIPRMPKLYEPVLGAKKDAGLTYYQVFSGPGTPFDGGKGMRLQDVTRGTSDTLLAVEAKEPVIWTKPADLPLPADKDRMPAVGGLFKSGFNILMCDGSVRFMPANTPPAALRKIIPPKAD